MYMINIKKNLIKEIKILVEIIKKEYKNLVDKDVNCYKFNNIVHVENVGTISLFVRNKNFYFPIDALKVLNFFSKIPGFGMMKYHNTCNKDNMIINNNTYMSYIKHVFLKGLSLEEYFKEILLHEVMHFCGSGGGTAIREGINELKTRQLAKKYDLITSFCGYPKEVKIAYELEKMFGEDIINKIAFSKSDEEIEFILKDISEDAVKFYFDLEKEMEKEFHNKYMKYKFKGILAPFKKTFRYNLINYRKAYLIIDKFNTHIDI